MKILLAEDEKITRKSLTDILTAEKHEVVSFDNGNQAYESIKKNDYDVIITDIRLPGMNGIDILKNAKELNPKIIVIIITAYASVETAVEALKFGAYDYLIKPFSPVQLLSILQHIDQLKLVLSENENLKKRIALLEDKTIIGSSEKVKSFMNTIKTVAPQDYTVLIQGESGTGKELCARTIHNFSTRKNKNFIAINCAVIPETLIESELFGHEKGAFTGAIKKHIGYFEKANEGTLFIDDIDDLPYNIQVKLLRVLQEKEISRVGSTESIPIDVRIICASKVDLKQKVVEKQFREDLYYRLNIIPIFLPPLRKRKEDIPELLIHFLKKHGGEDKIQFLNDDIYSTLQKYNWPGNVRELENITERIIALSPNNLINPAVFEPLLNSPDKTEQDKTAFEHYDNFDQYISNKEKEIINWALEKSSNNVTAAAKILKIPRTTLRSKMEKLLITNYNES
ncbi:MAG: sigma-54-dependent Fis family transcriptional regulator [Ignavibacteriota bacterium]|nr:sigma-54-dependent Fis family transcriptional regulator [Ignavibacteriota bacterium]MCO6446503.1 sigma-54-dependent Fis family transcriptional regulator [Ignavibacterium album]MCZ2269282.1 sigma-54 dependent transcriptional regulator [Ignavibacteriales bacterium]QKJ99806.1 MAG: sigma-54-dependent Fis family transcriptional regulator [Ignavibacteriota bacterium]HOJ06618.1 sigma-54 dependent transcriptional regulator [Ignavibacteriaceae bacterium]